jgi:hypothetical protein
VHTDFVDQRNARVLSAQLPEAQCPSEVHSWKSGSDRVAERPADALDTWCCTLEELVRTEVVDIGSPAWHTLIAQPTVPGPGPALELLGQPFVCSSLLPAAAVARQAPAACSRKTTSDSWAGQTAV